MDHPRKCIQQIQDTQVKPSQAARIGRVSALLHHAPTFWDNNK